MKKETFDKLLKEAAKEFSGKKKQPTTPGKQFERGALWAWQLMMETRQPAYYEEVLRKEIIDRVGDVALWMESLITDTARMMSDRDGLMTDIEKEGRLIEKWDKNMQPYKESNPLYVHLKEKERSIGMQREHLGLSFKVNPQRMKESPKETVDETDPMLQYYKGRQKK